MMEQIEQHLRMIVAESGGEHTERGRAASLVAYALGRGSGTVYARARFLAREEVDALIDEVLCDADYVACRGARMYLLRRWAPESLDLDGRPWM